MLVGNVCLAICVCLLIIVAPSAGLLAACLYCITRATCDHAAWTEKESLSRCSCVSNCHTDIYLIIMQTYGISITLVLYSVPCFCDCAYTEHCDTRYLPFLMLHLFFYESTERWRLFPSISVCRSQGQRALTVSPLMFGGLITAAAVALLGTDGALSGFVDQDQTLTTAAKT